MRTKSAFFRVAALFCAATGVLAFSARAVWGQQATFDVVSRENVMVPMRDGVKLATDVYLPARNGKPIEGRWPTVLSRTREVSQHFEHLGDSTC